MTKYLKTAYQFGVLGGVLSGLSFYVLSLFNPDPTNLNLVFGYVITPFAVYLAIKFYKEFANEGFISFAEGMTIGAVTYLILAILSTLTIWGILVSSPSLFEAIQTAKWAVLEQNKEVIIGQVGQKSFDLTQTNLKDMSPWDIAFNDGIWKILPGMFFSILISVILKKNKA
ncbi:MAG: hypothetical protein RLZZ358_1510 [Bacteroidota bacterium]|jgi:hypothetical protein